MTTAVRICRYCSAVV